MVKKDKTKRTNPIIITLTIIIGLFFLSIIFSGIIGVSMLFKNTEIEKGNVAVIGVKGVITGDSETGLIGSSVASSKEIRSLIKQAEKNDEIKAIVLEINSPGGSPVASEEIANTIKQSKKPTVAWIRETGASGGYWIASATNYIIASKMSITGSIGVIGSYIDFSGTLTRYNASYERLVAGQYKDIGSPLKKMTNTERTEFQKRINRLREIFIEEVAENRKLSYEEVEKVANGLFYLGEEAKEMKLIDEIGGEDEVEKYLEKKLNTTVELAYFKNEPTIIDLLTGAISKQGFAIGEGIGSRLTTQEKVKIEI